jgi:hypothetical protein
MALRWVTAAEAPAHEPAAVHVATALGLQIAEVAAGPRSWADAPHQHAGRSAAARDEIHPLLDDRKVSR